MSSWTVGLALAAPIAAAALAYLWLVRRPATEVRAGLRALANLRWREFETVVGQAMQRRGLRHAGQRTPGAASDPASSQLLMSDGERRWLLSCKHGLAYRLRASSVDELAAAMELAGARAGILLTEGRAGRDALAAAAARGIEVIDGPRLWPLLKPFVPADTRSRIATAALADARRWSVLALPASLLLGLGLGMWLPYLRHGAGTLLEPSAAAPAAPDPVPAPPAQPQPQPAPDAVPPAAVDGIEAYPDADTEARYQADVARTLSMVPGITRAYWLTRVTLVVERSATDTIVWPFICDELDRYPSLRTARVQLDPRPGTTEPVRWRQCRTM